jgi:hypothetical protein
VTGRRCSKFITGAAILSLLFVSNWLPITWNKFGSIPHIVPKARKTKVCLPWLLGHHILVGNASVENHDRQFGFPIVELISGQHSLAREREIFSGSNWMKENLAHVLGFVSRVNFLPTLQTGQIAPRGKNGINRPIYNRWGISSIYPLRLKSRGVLFAVPPQKSRVSRFNDPCSRSGHGGNSVLLRRFGVVLRGIEGVFSDFTLLSMIVA